MHVIRRRPGLMICTFLGAHFGFVAHSADLLHRFISQIYALVATYVGHRYHLLCRLPLPSATCTRTCHGHVYGRISNQIKLLR